MVNMIIIDDEPYIHTILSDFIDYEKIGVKITANASSVEEAMKMLTPDIKIAVIDIKMPGMSGADFVEYASDKYPWLKFIVLSGYDDFKYARQIFRCGAIDYFLKSELEPEIFEKTLKQAAELISIETSVTKNEDKIKSCIARLINSKDYEVEYDASLREFEKLQRRMMVLRIVGYNSLADRMYDDMDKIHHNIEAILTEELENNNSICIKRFNDLYVFLVNTGIMGKSYFEIYDKISEKIKKEIGCRVYAGLSRKFNSLSEIHNMYVQAKAAMEYCYVVGNGSVVMYSTYADCTGTVDVGKIAGKIHDYMYSMQFDKLREYISEAFDMNGIAIDGVENVRQLLSQCYYELKNYITNNISDTDYADTLHRGKTIVENGSVPEFKVWFKNELLKVSTERGKYGAIVSRTIAYMHKNYSDPELTLNNLAQNELFVTYNHMSRVFKDEIGMSFSQYLTQIRMKKAIELLQDGKYKLYEISEMVGYKNYESFSRTFKSYYHKSPKGIFK